MRCALLVCIAIAFGTAYWFSYPRHIGHEPEFNSPRESIGYLLTERFLDGHGYTMPMRHFDELPRDIAIALTPRDAAHVDGEVVPKDFVGTMLLYALVMSVHSSLSLFIGPAFAVASAWVLMRIGTELFGDWKPGALAFVAWLAFPPLFSQASFIFVSDLPALTFLLLAVAGFIRYWRKPTTSAVVLLAVCFSVAVLFRYPNVLLAPPFLLALVIGRKLRPSHVAAGGAAAAPFLGSILLFNWLVYGHPLTTGFHLGAGLIAETVNYSQESFFKQRPEVLVRYAWSYGTQGALITPVVMGASSAIWAALTQRGLTRLMAFLTVVTVAILVAYYGQQDAWGYRSPQVNASILRYLLPGFALCTLFGAFACVKAANLWGWGVYLVPLVVIIGGIAYAVDGPAGTRDVRFAVKRATTLEREVIAATEPDAIIAVQIMDKVLFPDRQTLTLTYAIRNETPFPKGNRETWDYVPDPKRMTEVLTTIHAAGIPVYLLPDRRMGELAPYEADLREHGYHFERVSGISRRPLFRLASSSSASE
jgi:hypothetical protein